MEFEEGMKVLAVNLGEQLEKSSVGNMLNKVIINPVTKHKQLKKIVIDPFIDMESGYPVKANARITAIMSEEIKKRFEITGAMEPDNLEVSEYVLNGMVTVERDKTVEKGYHDKLMIKSMQVKGDMLYEQKEYKKSLSYYDQAARGQEGLQLEVLNGQFTNLLKQEEWDRAEGVYAKLIRASIAETGEIASKITFNPNSLLPIESKSRIYSIYIRQTAKLVASVPSCRIKIIGHCSRTGKEAYNATLSLQRSAWILKEMSSYVPDLV